MEKGLSHESNFAQKKKLSFRASAHTGVGIRFPRRSIFHYPENAGEKVRIATPVTSVTGSQ